MDDRVPVREEHRLAHRAEEAQAVFRAEPASGAIFGDRHTVDVLDREPWRTRGKRGGVEQTRDPGVVELGEGPLLALETRAAARRDPGIAQHLDRHPIAQVGAFGEVDDAHPAFADYGEQAIRTDEFAGLRRSFQDHGRKIPDRPVDEEPGPRVVLEEDRYVGDEVGVIGDLGLQEGAALAARQFRGAVEYFLDPVPAGGVKVHDPGG